MNFEEGKRSTKWVKRLPDVVLALTGNKSVDAIKEKSVDAKSSMTYSRPVGLKEDTLLLEECEISLCCW